MAILSKRYLFRMPGINAAIALFLHLQPNTHVPPAVAPRCLEKIERDSRSSDSIA
ncbi:hypothetical protein [Nostoc sp. UHCC 0302]|uniref:hypothetical protein n=1 Tax=Nostoc sp. UHCC 0302 TaxID=3134896 RepID=UPI00311CBCD9